MRTILYFRGFDKPIYSRKVAGITAYAREHGWDVRIVPPAKSAATARRLVELWNADGCIVNCGPGANDLPSEAFGGVPVVYADRPVSSLAATDSCIYHDSAATTALAAKELIALNLPHYAYVGTTDPRVWDLERERSFREILELHGLPCAVFRPSAKLRDLRAKTQALAAWLKPFRDGIGIFAATDLVSEQVVEACRLGGLEIPREAAIIGVDNDVNVCECSIPTLSSVEPDYIVAGRKTAETLDRLMSRKRGPLRGTYGPARLVRRESTRRLEHVDRKVSEMLELIRKEACNGLAAAKALEGFGCSRRMAEIRFRAATGRSVLEEIKAVRLARAKELLVGPPAELSAIANFCGYDSASAFIHFFKAETGLTPVRWRKNAKGV